MLSRKIKSIRRSPLDGNTQKNILAASIVLLVTGLGVYLLVASKAAGPFASITANQGTLAGCAASQTDSTASNGHSVVFNGCGGGTGTTRYVSTGGSDSGTCTQAAPCLSFDRADSVASPGDTVQIAGGTYSGQTIDNHGKTGANIVFTPAPGATVTINGSTYIYASDITFLGAVTNGSSTPPATNFMTQTITIGNHDQTPGRINPDSVTLQNITGREFEIDSATNITVNGGSWGPSTACGGNYPGNNNSIRQPIASQAPTNITIENTVIHDIQTYDYTLCHLEGLAIFAGTNVTVTNSKFYNNTLYDILTQANSGGSPDHLTITNNWFAAAVDNAGLPSKQFPNGDPPGTSNGIAVGNEIGQNVTVSGNHFNDILNMDDTGSIGSFSNVTVSNNYGAMSYATYPCDTALPGIVWTNNVWSTNVKCGPTDTILNGSINSLPYVNHNNDSTMNYNLTH